MILFTIGDSWTYGDELDNPYKESYPYLLSKKLNCRMVNYAVNGGSKRQSNGFVAKIISMM